MRSISFLQPWSAHATMQANQRPRILPTAKSAPLRQNDTHFGKIVFLYLYPLGLIWKQGLADIEVEPSVPFNLLTPTTVLSNVTFNEDLKVNFIIHEEHPKLLRQLALEIINNISPRDLVIYTDGSKSVSGRTGKGIFMKTSTGEFRYRFRNPDHSSVFRSELIAISEALSLALDLKVPDV
ncbi:RNase H domain-containing protein [Caerostris extrusa]|uniref:RNase H domain-containing protein n=1 Tax=Caerostris extrusa TaxID=172846 RepID=A0AAV4Y1S6_CAEEX|nr:RNase H domain-containing protein [Caerostris extrusa]